MVISHRHQFVFVEIPHTGSHSISEQLVKHYGGEAIIRKHANVTQFLGQASADERRYFKFATVRNPLDALTTDFSKVLGNHKQQYTNPAMRIENGGHITPQHRAEYAYVHEQDGDFAGFFRKFRARQYNNWFLVGDSHLDYVIRFEALQDGYTEVLERIGVEQHEAVGHVNPTKSKKKAWWEYFTPDLHDQVAWYYGPFMKKWGYNFPDEWGNVKIPAFAQLQFSLLDKSAGLLAKRWTLDPDNQILSRCKRFVDFATGWR